MRGHWKPVVTTEEFERGLEILTYRDRHRVAKRRHVYLLKGLVYIEDAHTGKLIKLTGSTSNSRRKGDGTAYYCVWSSDINIRCDVVEGYIAELMSEIQVEPDMIPVIKEAYTMDIAEKLGHLRPSEQQELEAALKAVDEEEARAARLYAAGKITDHVWDALWEEWQDKRRTIQTSLASLSRQHEGHIADLDAALTIIAKVGILYNNLEQCSQRDVLREMVDKIVVDRAGNVVRMDLLPPFAYLKRLTDQAKREANSEGSSRNENSGPLAAVPECSDCTLSGGPEGLRYVN